MLTLVHPVCCSWDGVSHPVSACQNVSAILLFIVSWPSSHFVSIQQLVSAASCLSCSLSANLSLCLCLPACKCCLSFTLFAVYWPLYLPGCECQPLLFIFAIWWPLTLSWPTRMWVLPLVHGFCLLTSFTLSLFARMWVLSLFCLFNLKHSHSVSACQGVSLLVSSLCRLLTSLCLCLPECECCPSSSLLLLIYYIFFACQDVSVTHSICCFFWPLSLFLFTSLWVPFFILLFTVCWPLSLCLLLTACGLCPLFVVFAVCWSLLLCFCLLGCKCCLLSISIFYLLTSFAAY